MRGNGVSLYADVLPKIIGANKAGYRLVLPSCFRVPLSDERSVPIIAHADKPAPPAAERYVASPRHGDRGTVAASR